MTHRACTPGEEIPARSGPPLADDEQIKAGAGFNDRFGGDAFDDECLGLGLALRQGLFQPTQLSGAREAQPAHQGVRGPAVGVSGRRIDIDDVEDRQRRIMAARKRRCPAESLRRTGRKIRGRQDVLNPPTQLRFGSRRLGVVRAGRNVHLPV